MRDEKIDFLRFLGLAMIILAHMYPPGIIFQIRNFDVPLMVLVASLSFRASFRAQAYMSYLWSRAKRLILPVWIFLSIYFLFIYLTGYPIAMPSLKTMLSSYLLLNGIGYVWIIRVFLLVAIVAPFIYAYSRYQTSHSKYFSVVAISYLAYELLLAMCLPLPKSPVSTLFESTFLYLIPYAVVFALGLRLPDLGRGQLSILSAIAFSVFIAWLGLYWFALGELVPTQEFKYPPQSYYLSYAILVGTLAWMASEKIVDFLGRAHLLSTISFIGQHSIWIYLWHILFVEIIKLPFPFNYLTVFVLATVVTWLQSRLINNLILPRMSNSNLKKNLRLSLIG